MKYLIGCFLLIVHIEVMAQEHPIIDSLFTIGQLQISKSCRVISDHVIPTISGENRELVFGQLHNKNRLLVIKSDVKGFLEIGDNNFPIIKDYIHHFPIYKEERVFLGLDEASIDSLFSFVIPDFYLIYSYPHMFRGSGIGRQNLNFFTECSIKNFNDNRKNLSALNSSTSFIELGTKYEILNFKAFGSPHAALFEGFYASGKNDLETVDNIRFWNHEQPHLYERVFNIWSDDEASDIQENRVIIGFRDVKLKDNSLFVNEKKITLKSYFVDGTEKSVSDSSLLLLKKLHFNCLVLGSKVPDRVFEFCDSIGIYTIQVASKSIFPTIRDWVDHHILTKEHPSLIGWLIVGTDEKLLKIIKEIDDDRIRFNRSIFPVYTGINGIENAEFEQIQGSLQPVKFFYNGTSNSLEIQFEEYADFMSYLKLIVTSTNEAGEIAYRKEVSFVNPLMEKTSTIKLNDSHLPKTGGQFNIRFELVFKEDHGIFSAGELFAIYNLSFQKLGDMYKSSEIVPIIPNRLIINEIE